MTFVHVTVHHWTHTCPADLERHPYRTARSIVAVVDGGPCRHPVTVHCGDAIAVIPCGRHEPAERQCPACRITVIERHITTEHVGHHGPQHPTLPGIAA